MSAATADMHARSGDAADAPPPAPPPAIRPWIPWAGLAAVCFVAAWVLAHAGRGQTFYYDEWDVVLGRQAWSVHSFLEPHNEHLSAVPILIYKLLLETAGLDSFGAFRAVHIASILAMGLLLFVYARRRVGNWLALALAAALMLLGSGAIDLVWAFQMGFVLSVAAGIGAFVAMDRGTRAGDVLACVALVVSVASSGIGLPFLGAALIEVLWRPDRRRRWWIAVGPLALYALWFPFYGRSTSQLGNLPEVPRWILEAAKDAAGALFATTPDYGAVLVVILAFFAGRALVAPGVPRARLVALLALPLVLWGLTAFGRAHMGVSPGEERYLLPGAATLALVGVELARSRVTNTRAAVLAALVIGALTVSNAHKLNSSGDTQRGISQVIRGAITGLEVAGPRLGPGYEPNSLQPQLTAGPYLAATRKYGSKVGYPLGELPGSPLLVRQNFDRVLTELYRLTPKAAKLPRSPTGCTDGTAIDLVLPKHGATIVAGANPVEVRVRRYADDYPDAPAGVVPAGGAATLAPPVDAAPAPWRISAKSGATARVCPS
jgi:hypothetical protein